MSASLTPMSSRRRDFVEHERRADGFDRRLALRLAERRPVDVGLARIDALIHQPARELLEPAIDLAIDERLGHRKRHPCRQLLQHVGAHLAFGRLARFALEILAHAGAQRVERRRTRPCPSRTRRRAPAPRACGCRARSRCSRRRCRPARARSSRRESAAGTTSRRRSPARAARRRTPAGWRRRRFRPARARAWSSRRPGLPCRSPGARYRPPRCGPSPTTPSSTGSKRAGALAQLLERLIDGGVVDRHRRATHFDVAEVARIEGRQRCRIPP